MARYNLIKIGSTYLTNDGTASGTRCKTLVRGLGILQLDKMGTLRPQASGRPRVQTVAIQGVSISITIDYIHKNVHNAIMTVFQNSVDTDTDFELDIDGDTGTFNLLAIPDYPLHTDIPGQFSSEIIKQVTYNFRVTEVQ